MGVAVWSQSLLSNTLWLATAPSGQCDASLLAGGKGGGSSISAAHSCALSSNHTTASRTTTRKEREKLSTVFLFSTILVVATYTLCVSLSRSLSPCLNALALGCASAEAS